MRRSVAGRIGLVGALVAALFVAMASQDVGASSPSAYTAVVGADAPSAFWRLGESSGSSAVDFSGHGLTGTYGGSATLGATGLIRGDVDTAVSVGAGGGTLFTAPGASLPSGSASRSFELWFKTNSSTGAWEPKFQIGDLTVAVDWNLPGLGAYTSAGPIAHVTLPYQPFDNFAHHVVVTYGSGVLRLFFDGQEMGSGSIASLNTGSTLTVGSDGPVSVDEFAVYPSVLSTSQIRAHWTAGGSSAPSCLAAPTTGYGQAVVADGASRYWRLGEGARSNGLVAFDSSGACANAAYNGATTPSSSLLATTSDGAMSLPANQTGLLATGSELPTGSAARSYEFWFKTNVSTGQYEPKFQIGDLLVGVDWNLPGLGAYTSTDVISHVTLPYQPFDNIAHHVVVTYGGGVLRLYFDGQEMGSGLIASLNTGPTLTVGADGPVSVDDFAVYPTVLSTTRIRAHWTAGASTAGGCLTPPATGYGHTVVADGASRYWRLGEGPRSNGLVAFDSSGNCGNAAYASSTTPSASLLASTADGAMTMSTQQVGAYASATELPTGTADRSYELWFYITGSSGQQEPRIQIGQMMVGVDWNGPGFGAYTSTDVIARASSLTPSPFNGQAHHLVVTYTAGLLRLFYDGSQVASGPIATLDTGSTLYIRTDGGPIAVDEFAVYPNALTAGQVQTHFLQGTDAGLARPLGATWGGSAPTALQVGDPIDTATGNLFDQFTDLAPTAGLAGLSVSRAYNSANTTSTAMGAGWTSPYGAIAQDHPTFADIGLPDGRQVRFRANATLTGFLQSDELLARLSRDADTSLRLTFGGGEVWEFDVAGRLEKTTDSSGVSATVNRDGTGAVTTVVSSAGTAPNQPTLTFSYTGGLLTSIASSDGRSISYGYTSGRLTSATDAAAKTSTYGYDGAGRLSSVTDPTGVALMSSTYDATGRVTSQTTPAGGTETLAYDDPNRTTTLTVVAAGEQLRYVHDADRHVISVIDPTSKTSARQVGALGFWNSQTSRTGITLSNVRDARGNVTSATDPASGTTTATYDSSDRPLVVTQPATGSMTYSYAGSGTSEIPSSETDALGKVTSRTITNGLVMSETDPDGVAITYTYTPTRQVATSTTAGATTTLEYWPAGWLKKQTSPEGRIISYTYDGQGRPLTVTAPDGGVTTTTYDNAGRVLTVTDPTLAVTTSTYDAQGRLATVAKPGKPATTIGYDALGQPTTNTDPTGVVTEMHYGTLGRVDWTKDGAGRQTSYTYRDNGDAWKTTAPDGGVTENVYDTAGRLWKVIDPAGRTTTTTYDSAGRPSTVTAPDGGITTTAYDTVGRVSTVTDPTGKITTTTYTDAGRTKTVTDPAGVVTTYTYDASGRLWKTADPAGNSAITDYWPDGMLKTQTAPSGLFAQHTYTTGGYPSIDTDAAGVTTTRTWSLRGELLTDAVSGRGTQTFSYNPDGTMAWSKDARANQTTYAYDAAGRKTGTTTPVASETWAYTNGELTTYTAPPVGTGTRATTYGRDSGGRLNQVIDPTGRAMTDTFNAAGDVLTRTFTLSASSFAYTFSYDTAGRQTSVIAPDGTYGRTFDLAGRVTATTAPDGRNLAYTYDNGGRRSQTTTPDGLELVYGYDNAGRVQTISPASTMSDWFTGTNADAADANKWTNVVASGGTTAVDTNRLKLSTTATAGSSAGVASKAPQTANSITTVSFQANSTLAANQSRMVVSGRQNAGGTSAYRLELTTDSTTAKLIKKVSGTDTVLGTFTAPAVGTQIRAQLELSGTTVRAKAWAANQTPPGAWGASVTDSSIFAAGATQIRAERAAGTNQVWIDDFVQRNNQSTALAPFVTNTYNADSQVTNEAFAGGSRANTFTNGRLTKEIQTVPGANLTTDLTYDTAGAIATSKVGTVTTTYGYDTAGELLSATPSTGTALSWTYDASGRRSTSKAGTATTNYAYNAASQLTGITPPSGSATSFTYDLAGRRTNETTGTNVTANTYDQAGRLTGVTKTAASVVQSVQDRGYTPDGTLRRDTITNGSGALLKYLKFDWDSNAGGLPQLVSALDGTTNTGMVRNAGTWTAVTQGPTTRLVGTDAFGSVINSTSQPLANATAWDAYGQPAGASANNNATLGYRGELTIGGTTHLRARDYQANNGTFTTIDPLADVGGSPTVGNPYHYAYNDPINLIDPSGREAGSGCTNPYDEDDSGFGSILRNTLGRAETGSCALIVSHPVINDLGTGIIEGGQGLIDTAKLPICALGGGEALTSITGDSAYSANCAGTRRNFLAGLHEIGRCIDDFDRRCAKNIQSTGKDMAAGALQGLTCASAIKANVAHGIGKCSLTWLSIGVGANSALRGTVGVDGAETSSDLTAEDLMDRTPDEIRQLAQDKGYEPHGLEDAQGNFRKFKDPTTGNPRLRIDQGHVDPTTGLPYDDPRAAVPHAHGYDDQGNPIVDPDSGNKHFPFR